MDRNLTPLEAEQIRNYNRLHPDFFFEYTLGVKAWSKQIEIAESIINNRVTTVRSCHAAGKSFIAAAIAMWYLESHPESIVVTTAPTWRQVKDILWREINTRYSKSKFPLGGDNPIATGWQIDTNWYAIGLSTKDPDKFQGYHADSGNLLAITDEAAGMQEPLFEAIDAILTSRLCRLLMIGNPTSPSGTFRDSHKPAYPANKIKISAFDTPNFTANGITNEAELVEAIESKRELKIVAEYLNSPIWVYERIKKWGVGSPMYQARVAAEFPDMSENTLIPISWIEAACTNERLDKILKLNLPNGDNAVEAKNQIIRKQAMDEYISQQKNLRGVDVARFGSDNTVIQRRFGKIVPLAEVHHKEDTMQTAGRVWAQITNDPNDQTNVDVIGVGSGVVDRLRELQREARALGQAHFARILGVNVAVKADDKPANQQMNYANKRAELYWNLRDAFEEGNIYLVPDSDGNPPEELMDELSSIQYKYIGGKIYIEEKSEMKKRLLKSPDRADALVLTYEDGGVGSWSRKEETRDGDWEPAKTYDNEYSEPALTYDTEY